MDIKLDKSLLSDISKEYGKMYIDNSNLYMSQPYSNGSIDNVNISYINTALDIIEKNSNGLVEKKPDIGDGIRFYSIGDDGNKPIILVVGGVHGDEKSSVLGVVYSMNAIAEKNNTTFSKLLQNYSLYFIPCLNIGGFNNTTRENNNGVDLNRDFGDFTQEETKALHKLITSKKNRIKIILDSHNCGRDDDYYPFSFVAPEGCKNYDLYEDVSLKLRLYLQVKKPQYVDLITIPSPNKNTLSEYINRNGFIGHTLETVRTIEPTGDQKNYKSGVENTKDLLLNTMLVYSVAVQSNTK